MPVKPVTILVGEERFLLQRELEAIEKATLGGPMDDLNRSRFTAGSDPFSLILDTCQSLPMMAEFRLVIVDAGEKLFRKKKAADASESEGDGSDESDLSDESDTSAKSFDQLWLHYLANPSPSTRLVVLATKIDTRLKVWKTAQALGYVTSFKVPYADKMPAWVSDEARQKGLSLTPGAARALAESIGTNLLAQATTLEKLAVYAHPRTQITEQDVGTLVSDLSRTVFDLARAVGQRQFSQSQHLLENVLLSGEPPQKLFFMITRHFRLLRLARVGLDRRLGEMELARLVQVSPFFVKEYAQQAKAFSAKALQKIHTLLLKTDRQMKRGNARVALDEFLVGVCRNPG